MKGLTFVDKKYSQTSLIRTPKGQNQVSALQRCPHYRGRNVWFLAFLRPNELSLIEKCPYYRGVRKERLDCIQKEVPFLSKIVIYKGVIIKGWTLALGSPYKLCWATPGCTAPPVSLPLFTPPPQTFFNFFCCFIAELASVRINS